MRDTPAQDGRPDASAAPGDATAPDPADPGRGPRLPRHARREQLLGAAEEVFVRNGYHSAAMDDIAERAGVSKPVVYQHFPGKLELYLALLDRSADALIAAVRKALGSTNDNGRRVEATTAAYFDYIAHDAGTFRLIFESDLIGEPAVRERVDRVNQACAEAIKDVIAEDTGLGREAAMLLAAGLTGTAVAAARWWLTSPGSIDRLDAERLVSALSWRGISNVPRADDPAG